MKRNKKTSIFSQKTLLILVTLITLINTVAIVFALSWFQGVNKDFELNRLSFLLERDLQANKNECFKKQDLDCPDSKYVDASQHRKDLVEFLNRINNIK